MNYSFLELPQSYDNNSFVSVGTSSDYHQYFYLQVSPIILHFVL